MRTPAWRRIMRNCQSAASPRRASTHGSEGDEVGIAPTTSRGEDRDRERGRSDASDERPAHCESARTSRADPVDRPPNRQHPRTLAYQTFRRISSHPPKLEASTRPSHSDLRPFRRQGRASFPSHSRLEHIVIATLKSLPECQLPRRLTPHSRLQHTHTPS